MLVLACKSLGTAVRAFSPCVWWPFNIGATFILTRCSHSPRLETCKLQQNVNTAACRFRSPRLAQKEELRTKGKCRRGYKGWPSVCGGSQCAVRYGGSAEEGARHLHPESHRTLRGRLHQWRPQLRHWSRQSVRQDKPQEPGAQELLSPNNTHTHTHQALKWRYSTV